MIGPKRGRREPNVADAASVGTDAGSIRHGQWTR